MSRDPRGAIGVLGHGILGLLAPGPKSGYALTRAFDRTLANVWAAKHSQIYPELARLLAEGYVARRGAPGPRGRQDYAITAAGERELRDWLRNTEPRLQQSNESLLRSFFLWTLEPREAREYFEKRRAFHAAEVEKFEAIADVFDDDADAAAFAARVALESGIRLNRAAADWAAWAADLYRRAAEGGGALPRIPARDRS